MFFRKKAYFSEIIFSDNFYIGGVDVFSDNHRIELKNITVKLPFNVSFSKLSESKLYKIIGLETQFKIAISKVRDFYIISFISYRDFYKARKNNDVTKNSNKKNIELKFKVVAELLSKNAEDGFNLYSQDFRRKAMIENVQGSFKVTYFRLLIEDEYDFHFHDSINKSNFYGWEDEGTSSYYESFDIASKDAKLHLNDQSIINDFHGYQINH